MAFRIPAGTLTLAAAAVITAATAQAQQPSEASLGSVHLPISCGAVQETRALGAARSGDLKEARAGIAALAAIQAEFAAAGDGDRPEVSEAQAYLTQN